MNIKMKNLSITEFSFSDKRKYRFMKEMSEDPLINHFVSRSIGKWLEDSEGDTKLYIGPAYIIVEKRKLVGLIRMASLENKTINLHYGVHPDYRKQNYGTKILKETSNYLFQNWKNISQIELSIKEINRPSIRCAEKNGFQLIKKSEEKIGENKILTYCLKK